MIRGDEEEKRNMLHWSFMNLPYHSHGRVIKEYKTHTCDQVIHFMNKKETDFSLLDSLPSAVTRMHRKEWLSTQDEPGGEYIFGIMNIYLLGFDPNEAGGDYKDIRVDVDPISRSSTILGTKPIEFSKEAVYEALHKLSMTPTAFTNSMYTEYTASETRNYDELLIKLPDF